MVPPSILWSRKGTSELRAGARQSWGVGWRACKSCCCSGSQVTRLSWCQQLCAVRRSCVKQRMGVEREGGPESQKGRMDSAAWYVLNDGASCCDFQKFAWCKWRALNLLSGWGRLFPVCVSGYRRVYLEKPTCSLNLIVQQNKILGNLVG